MTEALHKIEGHTGKIATEITLVRLNNEIRENEAILRRFFSANSKNLSFAKELGQNLRMIKKISFFENFSITPEEIVEKLFDCSANELARVIRIESKVRSKNDQRIKMLEKYLDLKRGKESLSEEGEDSL